ncbi:MAG TPA: hypothetical protein VIJ17_02595, partial [Pseudolabrys sp.]
TGSIPTKASQPSKAGPGANGDLDGEAIAGSIAAPPRPVQRRSQLPSDDAIRAEERRAADH